jgi:hypothetical protein
MMSTDILFRLLESIAARIADLSDGTGVRSVLATHLFFAVESDALAWRDETLLPGCRSDAKKNDRERGPRHCARSYHFVMAVWSAKGAIMKFM